MTTLVQFFVDAGFKVTSDPNTYVSRIWALRNYTVNGYNYDAFCDGYHRAYDFASYHLAPIPCPVDGEVTEGTSPWGNFGGTVVVVDKEGKYQHIFGHLDRNIPVKVGQKVKRGQIIGKQSNTNYYGSYMASHLHYQVQTAGYRQEKAFVCDGIDPAKINIDGTSSVSISKNTIYFDAAWNWKFKVKTVKTSNYRIYPHPSAQKESSIPPGTELSIDRLYMSSGYWYGRTKYKGGVWFVALARKHDGVGFEAEMKKNRAYTKVIGTINTTGGRVDGEKNGYLLDVENTPAIPTNPTPVKVFNKYEARKRSYTAYFAGVVSTSDGRGAAVRKYSGGKFNVAHSSDLVEGDVVYIYEVTESGFARVYSGDNDGFVHLDRVKVTDTFV